MDEKIKYLLVCGVVVILCIQISTLSTAEPIYTVHYKDEQGDVLYYDENVHDTVATDKKPHIDFKECYIGNNNTTLFVKYVMHGNIQDTNNVGYKVSLDGHPGEPKCSGPYYKNGKATWHDRPINTSKDGNSLVFEIPIEYLEEEWCIWNGSYLKVWPYAEETSDGWYDDTMTIFTYNLINYQEQEPFPKAYMKYISPAPATEGQTVHFSGYGISSNNTSIVGYEWKFYSYTHPPVYIWYPSNQSSFNLTNLSAGTHIIYFRVKDSTGNWSRYIIEELRVNLSADAPTIEILSPSEDEKVNGMVTFSYKATAKNDRLIEKVEMKIGNGNWFTIFSSSTPSGSDYYNYSWDSTTISNGYHPIWLKAWDGKYYSTADAVMVYVDNDNVNNNEENAGILNQLQQNKTLITILLITAILIGLIVIKMKMRKRKNTINEGMIK
ncbi:MAG: hypothetical protein KJ886_05910 [Candidatus Thermoplasmatota archaeon]|nr:hypothetical protein [Candidatus Thermoplasmatota archaeon]MCG2827409.1 Ig-like domain-containing protein [Thermoplasmatales archaeon]